MDIRRYKDSIRTLAYIVLLTAINYFIPFLSMAVMILWPVPIVYLVQKKESNGVIGVVIIAALINAFLFGTVMGLMTIIGFGFVGFIIGNVIKEGLSPFKTLIVAVIAVTISQLLIFYVASGMLNLNYQTLLQQAVQNLSGDQQSLEQIITTQMNLIKKISIITDEQLEKRNISSSSIKLYLKNGKIFNHHVNVFKGNPKNPLSENEYVEKFKKCANFGIKKFNQSQLNELYEKILNLEKIKDISKLTRMFS